MSLTRRSGPADALRQLADEDLMPLVRAGEARAFEVLYERHAAAAFSLAYRMCGTRAAAEDVTQEEFLAAWRRGARYDRARGSVRSGLGRGKMRVGFGGLGLGEAVRGRTRDTRAGRSRLAPTRWGHCPRTSAPSSSATCGSARAAGASWPSCRRPSTCCRAPRRR